MTYFWTIQEHVPDGLGFRLFGIAHLLWLGGIVLAVLAIALTCRRWKPETVHRLLCGLTWAALLLEICKDGVLLYTGQFRPNYLPLDLCGLSIFVEFAAVRKPRPLLLESVYSLSLPGASLALLFPNWFSLPLWNFFSLHSFLLHGLLVLVPAVLLARGILRPNWKRLPFCFTCVAAACVPVSLVNRHFGTNFFFLERPSSGSPLVWFEQVFGSHLIGLPVLMALIWAGMYGIPAVLRRLCGGRR